MSLPPRHFVPQMQAAKRPLLVAKHAGFIQAFAEERETYLYYATEHFRMSGVYWGATALSLLGKLNLLSKEELVEWVLSCSHPDGGFGGSSRNDPHLLYTLSAIQILALFDELHRLDKEATLQYVASLQQPDGSFCGDKWGEVDTRFSFCALACCALLGKLSAVNVPLAAAFVSKCQNFDGGFGMVPEGERQKIVYDACLPHASVATLKLVIAVISVTVRCAESHAGQVFTCVAALAIANAERDINKDQLCWWLCERQTKGGGLNGRPEKLEDVCYSWWCLSALRILGRMHWIDGEALTAFILSCQDEHDGGISDRAEDECDVFHTFFGIAALSLLEYPGLDRVHPVYALPVSVVDRCLGIP